MSILHSRIREVLINNGRTPHPRAPETGDKKTSSGNEYYYDVMRYGSTTATKNKAEAIFDAQNTKLLGMPHQFLPTADFRIDKNNNFGYCFAKDIFMERPVITMMPGKCNYLPDWSKANKKSFGSLAGSIGGSKEKQALEELISDEAESRYYEFASDYAQYIRYVNLLCRVSAVYLGIDNYIGPDGKTKYKNYDWANYQTFNNYQAPVKDDSSFFSMISDVAENVANAAKQLATDVFAGYRQYIHFYVDPNTSVSETMTNTTQKSQLEGAFDSMEGIIKEVSFLTASTSSFTQDLQGFMTTAASGITSLADTATLGIFKNLLGNGQSVLNGANLIYPEIWMESDYSKSYNITMNLVSPYGDKEAIYLNVFVPMLHALALALPKQVSANTYTMPFIIRAFSKGWFSCDMGIIESISIDKGPDQSWTVEGLPTQVKITMTLKDLYSQLMISPSNKPSLFFSNQGMMDYLGSMCGIDLTVPNIVFKMNTVKALLAGINDIPSNIYRDFATGVYNLISNITG